MYRYCIACLFVILFISANAQKFKGGLSLGISTHQIDGDGYAGFNRAGIVGGVFVNTDVKEKWQAQFEINYIQKGSKDPPNPPKGKIDFFVIGLQYIEVPVLMKYRHKKFMFELGASYGRLIGEKQRDIRGELNEMEKIVGPFHKNEVAYQLGVAYNLSENLQFGWRNSASILPVSNNVVFDRFRFGFFGGAYNMVISFSLRYQFIKQKAEAT